MLEKLPPCLHLQRKPWMVQSAMKNTYPAVVSRKSKASRWKPSHPVPQRAHIWGFPKSSGYPEMNAWYWKIPLKRMMTGVPPKPLSVLIKKSSLILKKYFGRKTILQKVDRWKGMMKIPNLEKHMGSEKIVPLTPLVNDHCSYENGLFGAIPEWQSHVWVHICPHMSTCCRIHIDIPKTWASDSNFIPLRNGIRICQSEPQQQHTQRLEHHFPLPRMCSPLLSIFTADLNGSKTPLSPWIDSWSNSQSCWSKRTSLLDHWGLTSCYAWWLKQTLQKDQGVKTSKRIAEKWMIWVPNDCQNLLLCGSIFS